MDTKPWITDLKLFDKNEYGFSAHELKCKVTRQPDLTWSGAVYLYSSHPDYARTADQLKHVISVHGGLTYGPGNGVFGFDTNHQELPSEPRYWTRNDVIRETGRLAGQFAVREK